MITHIITPIMITKQMIGLLSFIIMKYFQLMTQHFAKQASLTLKVFEISHRNRNQL